MVQSAFLPSREQKRFFLSLLLILQFLLSTCSSPAPMIKIKHVVPHPSSTLSTQMPIARYAAQMVSNLSYGPLPQEVLDLCRPENAPGLRPVVLLIHGGGWVSGDKEQFDQTCSLLAQYGFVAATVSYRLATPSLPTTQWPAQLVDVQLAVRWMRSLALPLSLDPQRFCAWGDSAGAHLAVYLGAQNMIHPGDEANQFANEATGVSCVVDEFGPVDLTASKDQPLNGELLTLLGGKTFQQAPDLYREVSPIFSITPLCSPMLIVQGTQDVLVPSNQSTELQQVLQQQHIPDQYISYRGGHDFYGLTTTQRANILSQEINFLIAEEHP